jgi:enoyl-CoA hydratase
MSEEQVVVLEHDGALSTLTINRPKVLNALNPQVIDALAEAVKQVAARSETRCLIVTGAGEKAFVAGADIAAMSALSAADARVFAKRGHDTMAALEALSVPVIAAVNGFALGGGCELALACDFIYASDKSKFGQPEVNLGVIPGFGGTQRLARRVSVGVARELVYSAAIIDAQEALRIGLVNKVFPVDQLMVEVKRVASLIAQKGPIAVAQAKRVINEGLDVSLGRGNELEIAAFGNCFGTNDQKEGMAAFLEKRQAKFTNQ